MLADAVRRLADADAVLGRAADGGWWALGLRDPRRAAVLRTVPMSTADTGRLTWAALTVGGVRVAPLPVLRDVDGWADALAVAAATQAAGSPGRSPRSGGSCWWQAGGERRRLRHRAARP
ncbi:DUF2064 domain-containing protein [Micromonospora sp. R77]|nr:DUF2064 domain-containing protein [Micromonospora sp. R77]